MRGASACRLGGFIFCVRIRKTVIVARVAFPTALDSPPARGFFCRQSVSEAHISNLMFHLNYNRFIVDPHTTARDSQVSRVISSSRGA